MSTSAQPTLDPTVELIKAKEKKNSLKVFTVTWNMGNVEAEGLDNIFEEKNALKDFDLLIVGLQESTYTQGNNAAFDSIAHFSAQLTACVGAGFYLVSD